MCLQKLRLTSSNKVSLNNFVCVKGRSINIFSLPLYTQGLKLANFQVAVAFLYSWNHVIWKNSLYFHYQDFTRWCEISRRCFKKNTSEFAHTLGTLILPSLAEISGGIGICAEFWKPHWKPYSCFPEKIAKVDQIFCKQTKNMLVWAGRFVSKNFHGFTNKVPLKKNVEL